MQVVILANSASGRGRAAHIVDVARESLAADGHDVQIIAAQDNALANHLHAETLLVIAGGDGTLHHALPLASRAGCLVYHLPFGTENLFAREFGMKRDALLLRRAVQHGETRTIDLGDANGNLFALMCSVGLDAAVVHAVAAARTGPISHLSYVLPALRQFRARAPHICVAVDGEPLIDGRGLLIIANARCYGGGFNPACHASLDDGQLDVVFFPAETGLELMWWMVKSRLARHINDPRVIYRAASTIRVECPESPAPRQIDGEAAGFVGADEVGAEAPALNILLRPHALRVLIPPRP